MCISVVREYNPWFPDEGSMDIDNWKRVRYNVERAVKGGEKISIHFWSILYTLFKGMNEECIIENLKRETAPSITDIQLDSDIKEAIRQDRKRLQVISYTMLTGTGQYTDPMFQAQAPEEIHEQLREIGTEASERVRPDGEHYGSWTKVLQKTNEPYVEFLSWLKLTLERTVVGEEARQQLLKLLAYENANDDCKRALLPIKETGDVNTFLKA
ncbi:hypothetical protein STEG23_030498, partial [Scotinomys teguina]